MNPTPEILSGFFNEETLVRVPAAQLTLRHFVDKRQLAEQILQNGNPEEILTAIEEHGAKMRDSLMSFYLSAFIRARLNKEYEVILERLFAALSAAKKGSLIISLAKEFLEAGESLLVLNTLANQMQHDNDTDELVELQERILRHDLGNYVLPQKIAAARQKQGNLFEAMGYWKMAFFRALDARDSAEVLSIWLKLISCSPEDTRFFHHFARKVSSFAAEERKAEVFKPLYEIWNKKRPEHLEDALMFLKEMIKLDPLNADYRTMTVSVYRDKYAGHSMLEDWLLLSGLAKPWKSLIPQIEFFEKHIAFDVGSFVRHNSFGSGIIRVIEKPKSKGEDAVNTTKLTIDFEKKSSHVMTLRIALSSLESLSPDNLYALSKFDVEKARTLLLGNPSAAAEALLMSSGKSLSSTDLREIAVPAILTKEEWDERWKSLKNAMASDRRFELKNKLYSLSTQTASFETDLSDQFFKTSDISLKIRVFEALLSGSANAPAELLEKMAQALCECLPSAGNDSGQILVFLKALSTARNISNPADEKKAWLELINKGDVCAAFENIRFAPHRTIFIECICETAPDKAADLLSKIYFTPSMQGKQFLADRLLKINPASLYQVFQEARPKRESITEHYLLLVKSFVLEKPAAFSVTRGEMLLEMLILLEKIQREISLQDKSLSGFRKNANTISGLLFDQGFLYNWLKDEASADQRRKAFEQLDRMHSLEAYLKTEIREWSANLSV